MLFVFIPNELKSLASVRQCRTKRICVGHAEEDFAKYMIHCEFLKRAILYRLVFSDRMHNFHHTIEDT